MALQLLSERGRLARLSERGQPDRPAGHRQGLQLGRRFVLDRTGPGTRRQGHATPLVSAGAIRSGFVEEAEGGLDGEGEGGGDQGEDGGEPRGALQEVGVVEEAEDGQHHEDGAQGGGHALAVGGTGGSSGRGGPGGRGGGGRLIRHG